VTYYGEWSDVKSFNLIPNKPKLSSVKNIKTKTAVIKWKKVSGVTGYEVYRSTKKNSGFKKIATVKKAKTVSYKDKKVKKGKTFYYKIKAYKTVNKKTGHSAFSAVKSVKIKK
jgi:fibronectin type 3 domain-containing protein